SRVSASGTSRRSTASIPSPVANSSVLIRFRGSSRVVVWLRNGLTGRAIQPRTCLACERKCVSPAGRVVERQLYDAHLPFLKAGFTIAKIVPPEPNQSFGVAQLPDLRQAGFEVRP